MEIVIGVVSGVITATLISGFLAIMKKIILPWYQELRYEGVDLEGSWEFKEVSDSAETKIKLELEQSAHTLKGAASISSERKNGDNNFYSYVVSGMVWEGYVTLNMRSANRKVVSFSTMLLKVSNGGRVLKGTFAGRNHRDDKVSALEIELNRDHG